MKKKFLLRILLGVPIGITICHLITVVISLSMGDGNYYPVVPDLIESTGSEMNAVLLQTACSILYGAVWGGASTIWNLERWSLLRMTVTHLIIVSGVTLPIAYIMRWMPRNIGGILGYFAIFFGIYLFIWISQYHTMKKRIEEINKKVQEWGAG